MEGVGGSLQIYCQDSLHTAPLFKIGRKGFGVRTIGLCARVLLGELIRYF